MAEHLFARDAEDGYPHMAEHPDLKALDRERYSVRSYTYRSQGGGGRAPGGRTLNAIDRGTFIAGDSDAVIEQITQQQKQTGAGVLVIRPEMGALTLDQVADELDLFAKEVLPVIRKL
jgi:alkanesulfonate monooxygenase SsuD/methylene tetrahydromethanopterin reductase-like flavin-dependent oxidoreductase (luciferase family)